LLFSFVSADADILQHSRKAFRVVGGPTFLVNEGFEGTGNPAGWSDSGGDFDSTVNPLVGAQSLRADSGEGGLSTITPEATVYGKFRFRAVTLPATFTEILLVRDASFNATLAIILLSTGQLVVQSGGIYEQTVATMAANTTYYVWFRVTPGTGANSIARVWFLATDSKPSDGSNNSSGATNGSITTSSQYFLFWNSSSAIIVDFDTVQLAATDF